ncbi:MULTISPECIES: HAMP domain-containing protein [Streptomyces]|uniref:Circadian input-output histidine kinase CikA n=2 Tax=Streptomyces avermitilis TaxID=33903 RepID=Q82K91_STRAW|nr:HAMP domain-containing protein [Streptomyces avermitilis]MYS98118.1 HAMP domain-containing protein [Streptomyces sp. SID5469]BAC70223.1 putative two-component system sensor kinase (response to osmoadaptation and osmtic stress) [Streptomyces avermitilis MA-4680 = NBRC 14893]BBJ50309.1 histidine kinase [Streptomyces avermitilis]GDY62336.1 histidine kinase [Streptomyces avermitilis]GDY77563.1 histidine kinase [Streptomyces avermitilis]
MESGAATRGTKTRAKGGQSLSNQRKPRTGTTAVDTAALNRLLAALVSMRDGNFRKRLTVSGDGVMSEIAAVFNEVAERNLHLTGELARVRRMVGREGKLTERLESGACEGSWAAAIDNSNALVDDLARPVSEVSRVLSAVAEGDLSPRMELRAQAADGNGHPLRGEFLKVGRTVNNLVDQLSSFTDEVTRVASEVGTEGKLGGQARVRGMSGSWKDLTDSVNTMAYRLTAQVRDIALVTTAVAKGDLSRKVTVHVAGEMLELKNTVNTMVDQLSSFSSEVTRVAREVGTEGELGGQAQVPGVAGVWKDLTDSVNLMAGNLTAQVRGIAQVTTAVANGDLSQKVTVSARGEVAQLAETINQMTETLRTFADEVTRVANEVGGEGRLGGQANVPGAAGTWKDLTDSVNTVFRNLTTQVRDIAAVTTAVANGDLSQKVTVDVAGEMLELKNTVNTMVDQLSSFGAEVTRVAREVGVEGELGGQAQVPGAAGTWKDLTDSVNTAFRNLTGQVRNIAQVTTAVANGDLSQKVTVDVSGEMLQLKNTVNTMVDQLSSFADQVTRMARDVGTEGRLGGQARVDGVSGTWKELTDSVNFMAGNLTSQVRQIAQVTTAVARGDLSQKIDVDARGEILELKNTINTMVDQLSAFADQVTRVAREVGTEGRLGGQAQVPGVAGVWRDLTDSVNGMAGNLTAQVRNIAQVATAVARGDLSQKIDVDARGEILELKNTLNTMVDQLSNFAEQVTRVAREVGTEGMLGGQAEVQGVSGTWKDLTQSVNFMANNLTIQVRNIAEVTTAVAKGDLSKKITVDAKGEILELVTTVNTMVDQLSSFAEQVTRVAREVGTEGILGGQAHVPGVTGIWKDLSNNVNLMANNLTMQVRNISQVAAAVANGDLTRTVTIEARGEVAQLADTFNTMVKTLSSFADQVTKVAREVGTDGILGGQAHVPGVAGTWKDLTESVNGMASNLTGQVRNIAMVTTAIAKGDLTKKIDIDARGEILELKTTINTMVDQLSSFAEEVTRVAREVGTEGQLGGQARVRDVDGTWRDLTESVNEMAGNLTRQVRAIARVATAVTRGDLNLKIDVDASGEIQELQDYINKMIANLRDTTIANKEQDWLKGNLARISALMQGRRDLDDVASLIMSELTPVVSAQHGAFFLAMPLVDAREGGAEQEDAYELRMCGSYGYSMGSMPTSFRPGEALIGTAAQEKRTILVENAPSGYLKISSGLGEAPPAQVIVLPVLFEGNVLGVIELASFTPFTQIQKDFLNQIAEMIATSVNTISVNTKTEVLLKQSQELTEQLRERSAELENRQKALQASNAELEEKAELLAQQNRDIEVKNTEIEEARQVLEERAEQLAVSMRYKSEFLANMSHELRTPLNSLLILAKLLADNADSNLTPKQVEFAETIHGAGSDLLQLINDILDLSKVEAGKMDVSPTRIALVQLVDYVEATFRPLTAEKGLDFSVRVSPELPATLHTDEQRLLQVLRNLLSNAVKFTDSGAVELVIRPAGADVPVAIREQLLEAGSLRDADAGLIAFSVTDTGIGIAASKMRVIFEAFKQADGTTSRKYGGTGLGLSISREIARLLGGEIHAASEPGRGSTFTLYLPLHPSELPPQGYAQMAPTMEVGELLASEPELSAPDIETPAEVKSYRDTQNGPAALFRRRRRAVTAAEERTALPGRPAQGQEQWVGAGQQEPAPQPRRGIRFDGEKVLIVDDDIRNVFALTSVLEQHGLSVLYAENGREGIEVLEQHDDVTVVLMDIMMPEMDGYATTTAIRRMPQFAGLPIIALTAKAMKGDREKAIESGASDYVTKPVDPDHLLTVMEQWMRAE